MYITIDEEDYERMKNELTPLGMSGVFEDEDGNIVNVEPSDRNQTAVILVIGFNSTTRAIVAGASMIIARKWRQSTDTVGSNSSCWLRA